MPAVFGVALMFAASVCHAHFLWLKTITVDDQTQAFLFFGENVADEAYHLPEPLAKTEIWRRAEDGKRAQLEPKNLDTDDRVGLSATLKDDSPCVLEATQTYGIYGKSLLTYYAKHIHADSQKTLNAAGRSKKLKLDIVPDAKADKLRLTVFWDNKPLEGAKLSITVGDEEPVEETTTKEGVVTLERKGDGMVSVLGNYLDKKASGEFDGKKYAGVMHYASLTFGAAEDAASDKAAASGGNPDPQAALVPLPEPLSSFGAAVADGWLYVYSGHTGDEHEHSVENLSKHFRRLKIEGGAEWEDLPMQTPLQGLALVAHGGKIYRMGGLNARNATKEDEEDLHSTADFAEFDPASGQWKSLASLPAPRSSHNAVVIADRLYVVGGWHLHGKSPGDWQPDALVYEFANPDAGWQKLPEPPFKRRALAVGNWHGKLVAIGGMDEKGRVSRRVDLFDPQSGQWSEGPKLPGAGMAGFGGAACDIDGQIFVSGLRGVVYRLNDSGSAWEEATRMTIGRFFHQLLPTASGGLLAVGGASRKDHLADIEWIDISSDGRRL